MRSTASLPGFATIVRQGITLTVGQDVVVDMRLKLGEITDEIVVVGEAPLIDTIERGCAWPG